MYNVLVCDDERDIVSALRIYLTAEGYQVYEAYNGKEALEVLARETIHLVLTGIFAIFALIYGGALAERFVWWAKKALTELYEWSGTKIDTACFCVTTFGDFSFGQTEEDIRASRVYYSRRYGTGAGFEDCIEGMDLVTERTVWYSPVTQWKVPEDRENRTDEQLVEWYFSHLFLAEGEEIGTIQYEADDDYIVRTKSGRYYDLFLDPVTRELSNVCGPYEEYPNH